MLRRYNSLAIKKKNGQKASLPLATNECDFTPFLRLLYDRRRNYSWNEYKVSYPDTPFSTPTVAVAETEQLDD